MNHRDTENTEAIIGAGIEVHKHLGPGMFESAYESALEYELRSRGHSVERQRLMPLLYKGVSLVDGYRLDMVVDERIIVELKCVEAFLPIHEAQLISYLRLAKLATGLLLNFKVPVLKQGVKRVVV